MTDYVRKYTNGSDTDYYRSGATVDLNFSIAGMDGSSVSGSLDVSLLTEDQINELCAGLQAAGAAMSWILYSTVTAAENGTRSFTVAIAAPPVNP